MKSGCATFFKSSKIAMFAAVPVMLAVFAVPMQGQEVPTVKVGDLEITGLPQDWSDHHVIFPNPGTEEEAIKNGTHEQWLKIVNDPRYVMQQMKRHQPAQGPSAEHVARFEAAVRGSKMESEIGSGLPDSLPVEPPVEDFSPAKSKLINDRDMGRGLPDPLPITPPAEGFKPSKSKLTKDWNMSTGNPPQASLTIDIATPLTSTNISGSSTLTVAGETFDASAPTSESATLTVTSLPTTTGTTVTVANGSHNFVLTGTGSAASSTINILTEPTVTGQLASVGIGPYTHNLGTGATQASYGVELNNGANGNGNETKTGSISYSFTGYLNSTNTYTITLSPTGSSNSCSYSASSHTATGFFQENTTATTEATNFQTALNACVTDASLTSYLAVSISSDTVTLKSTYFGNFLTVSNNNLNNVTNSPTAGSNGTPGCSVSSNTYTVDYLVSNSTSSMASSLNTELAACSPNPDITLSYTSGNSTIGVTASVLGTGSFSSSFTSVLSFTGTSAGSDGTNACTSNTAGTFGTGSSTSAVATAISAAINACTTAVQQVTGINNASSVSGSGVTIYAYTPGTTGGSGISVAAGSGLSASGGGALSGGSDGTTSGTASPPTFAYWSGSTYISSPTLAANIATAVNANTTTNAEISAAGATGSGGIGTVTFTALVGGTSGNSYSASDSAFTAVSGTTNFTGGANATSTVNPNTYPAKYSFSTTTSSCSDYVVYPTGFGGTEATIVGYNNLYLTTCSSAPPTVAFAYNTGGTAGLSPTLSIDGTQIAFVESVGTTATLVIMTPSQGSGGTVSSPASITSVSNSNYQVCTAPCYTTIAFNGSANDSNSSPFYDFFDDVLYVGDDNGALHKFTGVFNGNPTEVVSSGVWPVTVASGSMLTSPIFDFVSGNVFVGSAGGYLYYVPGGTNTVAGGASATASGHVTASGSEGIQDAPLVDSLTTTSSFVYVFVGDDPSGYSGVYQFANNFPASPVNSGSEVVLGNSNSMYKSGSTTTFVYDGAFDDYHYNGSGSTGNLYVCAGEGGSFESTYAYPGLYQINLASTFSSSTVKELDFSFNKGACSPMTEFLGTKVSTTINESGGIASNSTSVTVASATGIADNDYIQIDSEVMKVTAMSGTSLTITRAQLGTTAAAHANGEPVADIQDWVYLSMTSGGDEASCTGACLYNYLVTSGASLSTLAPTAGIAATGGASGVIVDNSLTATGESEIYYVNQGTSTCTGNTITGSGTGTCAVQTSQSTP